MQEEKSHNSSSVIEIVADPIPQNLQTILRRKVERNCLIYLVKWKNLSGLRWEPITNLKQCLNEIQEFQITQKRLAAQFPLKAEKENQRSDWDGQPLVKVQPGYHKKIAKYQLQNEQFCFEEEPVSFVELSFDAQQNLISSEMGEKQSSQSQYGEKFYVKMNEYHSQCSEKESVHAYSDQGSPVYFLSSQNLQCQKQQSSEQVKQFSSFEEGYWDKPSSMNLDHLYEKENQNILLRKMCPQPQREEKKILKFDEAEQFLVQVEKELEWEKEVKIQKILKIKEQWYILVRVGSKMHLKSQEEAEKMPRMVDLMRQYLLDIY